MREFYTSLNEQKYLISAIQLSQKCQQCQINHDEEKLKAPKISKNEVMPTAEDLQQINLIKSMVWR